jgi:hypothetical protein
VVIGGLIQEREIYAVTKVPLLGDIPILGYLFKFSTKTKKKTNLLILLTPYIIKDQLDLQQIRERKVRERQEFVESFATLNEMKYEPKVDYRRKRGLVEEINRSIQSVEDDVNAASALGRRRFVEPGPVEYGPSRIESPEDSGGTPPAPPARPDGKQPAPVRPAPKTPPKAEPKSQLDSPAGSPTGAPAGSPAGSPAAPADAGAADGKQSRAVPGKSKSGAVSPADMAAAPSPKAKKPVHKPDKASATRLASERDGKAKKSTRSSSTPADRAADEPAHAKSRSRTLRDLSPAQKEAQ